MTTASIIAVHALHVMAGLVWAGGHIFMALVVWPTLLDRDPVDAQRVLGRLSRSLGPLMAVSATLVIVLGVARGVWIGPIASWDQLLTTPYGRTFSVATLVTVALAIHGARSGRNLGERLFEHDEWRPGAAQWIRIRSTVELACLTVVVSCMVLLRFGL